MAGEYDLNIQTCPLCGAQLLDIEEVDANEDDTFDHYTKRYIAEFRCGVVFMSDDYNKRAETRNMNPHFTLMREGVTCLKRQLATAKGEKITPL